jgi:hypothetical protein
MPQIPLMPQIPQPVATLVGALIGALIGSIGAAILTHWLTRRREEDRIRKELVQRHLFQLQDATESLWYRLQNLIFPERYGTYLIGVSWKDGSSEYFKVTTLYALGKLLAVERIFALEGIYPQLDAAYGKANLGKFLREHRTDLELRHIRRFPQYDRIFLAEAAIEGERERFRASTFVEFVRRYEATGSPEKERLDSLWLNVKDDDSFWRQMMELLDHLHTFAQRILKDADLYSRFLTEYDETSREYDTRLAKLEDDKFKTSTASEIAYTLSDCQNFKEWRESKDRDPS